MLHAEILDVSQLDAADLAAWRALCAAEPAFGSPLLSPDFACAMAEVRDDVRVAVWRRDGRPIGFLPHHRRPGAFARPIGSALSDYHALVGEIGVETDGALALAGLSAFRFSNMIDPAGIFDAQAERRHEGFAITLTGTADDYLEALRAASPKRFKNYRRLDHKFDREVGELRVVAPDTSRAAFDAIMAWKAEQLSRTGAHDFLRPAWVRQLMERLFERRDGNFQGLMVSLYAGDRLVGAHFGVRLGAWYHPWVASTEPEFAPLSPGQIFLPRAIAVMPELGLTTYDLGPSHEHYKRPFALTTRTISEGIVTAAGSRGRAVRTQERAWDLVTGRRGGAVDRLRRRLDAIAALEPSLAGRALSLAAAVAAQPRRHAAVEPA